MARRRLLKPDEIEAFFARLKDVDPAPQTELVWSTPYTLLVSVVLSAQATDVSVNKATARLFPKADTPEAMLRLGEEGLRDHIKTIGLYNAKAKNVIALSEALLRDHAGRVPDSREALMALPGVGRKTANVVMNSLHGAKTIAVDTHVFRVANRTGLAPGKTVRAVEDGLMRRVPEHWQDHAHHWLILLGRYTCVARKPRCLACPVADLCLYKDKTQASA
ncbi:MAG: endonuclease III [Alphaproteobacteria bacterium]